MIVGQTVLSPERKADPSAPSFGPRKQRSAREIAAFHTVPQAKLPQVLDEHCQNLVQRFFAPNRQQAAPLQGKKKKQAAMDFLDMIVDLKQKSVFLHEQNLLERNRRCVRKFFDRLREKVRLRKLRGEAKSFSVLQQGDEKATKGFAATRKVQLSINTSVSKEGQAVSPGSSPFFRPKGSPLESTAHTKKKRFVLSPLAASQSGVAAETDSLVRRGSIRAAKRDAETDEKVDCADDQRLFLSSRFGLDAKLPRASKFSKRSPALGFTLHVPAADPAQ